MRGLRVLFTSPGRSVGGATMAMFNLMLGLASLGHEPLLISGPPSSRFLGLYSRLRGVGVRVHIARACGTGALHWSCLSKTLLKEAKKLEPDLIHVHSPKEALALSGVAASLDIPLSATFEGDPLLELMIYGGKAIQRTVNVAGSWIMARSKGAAACSRWLAARLSRRYSSEVRAIPNPVDAERFIDLDAWRGGRKVILALARLERVKGIHVLVRAAPLVIERCRDSEFWVAGEGALKGELEDEVIRLGLAGRFRFLGYSERPESLIGSAYVLVAPSLYEPFGMPAAEAALAARPAVVSNTGGLSEIVVDGKTGLLAKPGDAKDLAEKITELLLDEGLARRMAAEARRRASRLYTPHAVATEYLELYRTVLS